MDLLNATGIILSGFTIVATLILFIVYVFFLHNLQKTLYTVSSCLVLLITLSLLQAYHLSAFLGESQPLKTEAYRVLLFAAPPLFYFFSRAVLQPQHTFHPWLLLHLAPIGLNFVLRLEIAIPLIFLIGAAYSFWLVHIIFRLRAGFQRYKIEIFFFSMFAIIAILVLIFGFSLPYINPHYFYVFYASSIGLSFALIVSALIAFPDLVTEITEAATLSYSSSTLKDVDIKETLEKLQQLMNENRIYQNDSLNLTILAEQLGLSSHQLSELINVHFGIGFSRYVREQRIEAAKQLLLSEPDASVLSISMETGFKTQSNFYAAFKEVTGDSPGNFRKQHQKTS